jgi:hypothetical protein
MPWRWNMKKYAIISISFILLCYLIMPLSSFASTTYQKAHRKAVIACEGKKEGDSVQFINKWYKRVMGVCREEKGELFAVPVKKQGK